MTCPDRRCGASRGVLRIARNTGGISSGPAGLARGCPDVEAIRSFMSGPMGSRDSHFLFDSLADTPYTTRHHGPVHLPPFARSEARSRSRPRGQQHARRGCLATRRLPSGARDLGGFSRARRCRERPPRDPRAAFFVFPSRCRDGPSRQPTHIVAPRDGERRRPSALLENRRCPYVGSAHRHGATPDHTSIEVEGVETPGCGPGGSRCESVRSNVRRATRARSSALSDLRSPRDGRSAAKREDEGSSPSGGVRDGWAIAMSNEEEEMRSRT